MILTVAAFGGGSARSVALAQDSTSARLGGTIAGVVDGPNGQPLAGVTVEVLGVTSLRTDSTGEFRVMGLAAGSYIVRARKVGYLPAMKLVTLAGGAPLQVPITLGSAGQRLPTVVSNADSAALMLQDPTGFSWRERMGQGVYLTEAQIERRRAARTEQLFQGIPSLSLDTAGIIVVNRGRITIRDLFSRSDMAQTQWNECVGVQVFVDGVAEPQPFNVNQVPPGQIRGIEVYYGPATTPEALRSSKTVCGTVAIWTR